MRGNIVIFLALAISGVINFLSISLFSRHLTPEEYGVYAVIMASTGLVLAFIFSWLDLSFGRFVAGGNRGNSRIYFNNFTLLYSVLLLIFTILLILLSLLELFPDIKPEIFLTIGLVVLAEVTFNVINIHTRLMQNALNRYAISIVARSCLLIGFSWVFLVQGYSYHGILMASVISFMLPTLFSIIIGQVWSELAVSDINKNKIKEILRFGAPLIIVMAVQSAINATDRLLLAGILGSEAAGQYSVSQDLVVKLFIFLLAIVHKVGYPNIIKEYEAAGEDAVRLLLNKHIIMLLLMSIPAVFAMSVYAENIVSVILGEGFREVAINLMPYQVGAAFINCLIMFYIVMPFHLLKKTKLLIVPNMIALIANLIVGYFLIKLYGMYGALMGSFVAYALCFCVSIFLGRKLIALPFPKLELLKIIASSALMIIMLLPFKESDGIWSLAGLVLSGIGVYGCCIMFFNVGGFREIIITKIESRKVKR